MFYLSLWVFRTQAGRSLFDHICQFGNSGHRRLGSLGQSLLTGSSTRNQQLGVLHESLGRLQNAFSEKGKVKS